MRLASAKILRVDLVNRKITTEEIDEMIMTKLGTTVYKTLKTIVYHRAS
jgi:aldehyde:ferredoxin oxidoreductase